jgi:hypothetical protein
MTDTDRLNFERQGRELVLKFHPELRVVIAARQEELRRLHENDHKRVTPVICTERV